MKLGTQALAPSYEDADATLVVLVTSRASKGNVSVTWLEGTLAGREARLQRDTLLPCPPSQRIDTTKRKVRKKS